MTENEISGIIVDCALKVHRKLGPGLLESIYEEALSSELINRGLEVTRQLRVEFAYGDGPSKSAFRIDILVNQKVIIEIKSVEEISPVHHNQLLTYLKLTGLKLGLLINFNVPLIKHGIQRIVNGL